MFWRTLKFKLLIWTLCLTPIIQVGCKAKSCPAYHEGERTGGSIDKNKKRKKKKVKQGVFGPKVKRRR